MLPAPTVRLHRRAAGPLALLLRLLLTGLLTGLISAAGTGTADAAVGYKYWNYFHVDDGKYVFATTGPADFVPKDGSVEAYRYGLSSTAAGLAPRTDASTYTADDLCKGVSAEAGEKKVGVLIDYGTAADAGRGEEPAKPRADCAVVPTKANGQQVLDAVADVRLDKQLLCGIDGYPVKTCSVTVKNAPRAAKQQQVAFALPAADEGSTSTSGPVEDDGGDGGVPWPLVGVVAAVVVVGGAALALGRRRTGSGRG